MIYVILAAYNEEKDLPPLLEGFLSRRDLGEMTVILVDDGSTDATAAAAASYRDRLPMVIVTHPENRGLGRALASGFARTASLVSERDIVVTMDADNSHPAGTIALMKEAVARGSDVVIASRFAPGGKQCGVPAARKALSLAAGVLLRTLRPIPGVRDYTSGYRAFSGAFFKRLSARWGEALVTENGFPATVEILLKASRLTKNISEVPLELRYDKKTGKSKIRILRTILRYVCLMARMKRFDN